MMTMDSDRYVTKTMMRNEKRTQQQTNGEHACVALGSALHLIFLSLCL